MQVHVAFRLSHHRAERVNNHHSRVGPFNFFCDFRQDRAQVLLQHNLAQVDEANRIRQLGGIEKCVLLLISQHLYGGFAEDGEIERRTLWGRIGEDELVCQRGLSASGGTRDDVEGEFGKTATHDFVEARDTGWQLVDRYFLFRASRCSPIPRIAIVKGCTWPRIVQQAQR